jgi:hypothetical protein
MNSFYLSYKESRFLHVQYITLITEFYYVGYTDTKKKVSKQNKVCCIYKLMNRFFFFVYWMNAIEKYSSSHT